MSTKIKPFDSNPTENEDQSDTPNDKLRGPKNIVESQNAYLAASLRTSMNDDHSNNAGTGKKITIGLIVLAVLAAAGMFFKGSSSDTHTEQSNPKTASSVQEDKSESNESPVTKNNVEATETTETTKSLPKPAPETASDTATKETRETKKPEALRLAANKLVAELVQDETTEDSKQPDLYESSQETKEAKSGEVDYYNTKTVKSTNKKGLQNSIDALMNADSDKQSEYTTNLHKEAEVRHNAVRSIALEKGDTLWSLAKRAYGDGLHYHKILEANPQITEENARKLKIGTLIRVPN